MADFSIAATARKSQATANGSTTQFAFAFSVNVEGDIAVYVNTTLKTISTHYTVSITANTGAGSITFTSGNTPSNGQIVTIMSKTALARTSVYTSGGTISASALESDFDTNMMLFGQLQEQIDRTIKFPVQDATSLTSTLPIGTSRAGFLTFDASGNVTIDTLPAGDLLLETDDGAILSLTSTDTTITADSVLGAINFSAPSEASGTDAILTGAAIQAVAEGTFAADSNATKLLFKTGASEAATTKMTLTSAGNLTVTGALNAGSLVIGGADISGAEFEVLDSITPGSVAASKAVVVDANKDISSFRNLTASGAITGGSLVIGSADIAEAELEMIDGITAGTILASKAVVVDANKDISSFRNLTATGAITGGSLVIGSADIAETELEMLDGITAGTVAASKAVVVDANKDISSFRNVTISGKITSDSNADVTIEPNGSGDFVVETDSSHFRNTDAGQFGPKLFLDHATSSPAANDYNAQVYFKTTDLGSNIIYPLRIDVLSPDVTDSAATGKALFNIKEDGASDPIVYLELDGDSEEIILWKNTSISGDVIATGSFIIGSASMSEADLEQLDGITAGTVAASKALVVDSNKKLNELLVDNLQLNSSTLSSTDSNGHIYITPDGTGNIYANTDLLQLTGADGEETKIILAADNGDDNGDDWVIQANTSQTLQIGNNISGSQVAHLTITPHATVASSTSAFAGKITAGNDITATGSFIIGSASMSESDLEKLDGIVNGQGAANKALVLDASSDIENIRNVTATGFFKIGNASMDETDLEKLDGITNGTVEASKALVVDSNKKLNELLVDHLSLDSRTLSSTESNGHIYITPNGTGNLFVHTDTLHILAADSEYARIQLSADNSDDPADDWIIQSNTSNTFQIGNDISGSAVAHLTITPHATVASSIAAFAGKITSGGAIEPASLSIHNTTSAASVYLQQDASGPQPLSKFFMIMNGGPQSYDSDTAYIHVDDGTINIKPAAGVSGASISVDGVVDITDSTDATDATGDTGALRTEGGASIAKKLYVGTDLDVTGDAVIDGTITADGLTVDGVGSFTSSSTELLDLTSTGGDSLIRFGSLNSNFDVRIGSPSNPSTANGSFVVRTAGDDRLLVANNGDISFYEDTGTTAKLQWSASNERLGLTGSDYQFYIQQGSNEPWYNRAVSDGSYRLHLNGTGDIITADSSGRLLLGNTDGSYASANADNIVMGDRTSSANSGITFGSTVASSLRFADAGAVQQGMIQYVHDDTVNTDYMNFYTVGTERMRITSTGVATFSQTRTETNSETDIGAYVHLRNLSANLNTGIALTLGSNDNSGTAIAAQRVGSNNEHIMKFQVRNSSGASLTRATIDGDGDLTISDGNLVIGTSGHGIDFSVGAAGASTSNLLDEYEFGTFTPVYEATGTAFGAIAYASQVGEYIKVGGLVTINLLLKTSSFTAGSTSGNVQISGLPFAAAGGTGLGAVGSVAAQDSWLNFFPLSGWVNSADDIILVNNNDDRTSYRQIPVANMSTASNGNRLYLTATYIAS